MVIGPGASVALERRRRTAASFTGAYDAIPNIAAAYGMRRMRSAYTGSLLRLRRSSDNAESDFGYDADGHLDTAAISAWLSGSGYIVTWYDQSGNGYNATQSTAASQPLYVASGQNGRPVGRWDGTNDYLYGGFSGVSAATIVAIGLTNTNDRQLIDLRQTSSATPLLHLWQSVGGYASIRHRNNVNTLTNLESSVSFASIALAVGIWTGSQLEIYVNGNNTPTPAAASGATTIDEMWIGSPRGGASGYWNGDISELIICNAALSTGDRQAAEAAANDYWTVY